MTWSERSSSSACCVASWERLGNSRFTSRETMRRSYLLNRGPDLVSNLGAIGADCTWDIES